MPGNGREKFTYRDYRELLRRLLELYRPTTLQEGKRLADNTDSPLLILRHDIDMDLEAALRIATIEREMGIQSTFFFMVTCPLYNVFSCRGAERVRQILGAGHGFALHFDCAIYQDISNDNINHYISRECQLLESFFNHKIESVSFHRPGNMELSGLDLKQLPNSYEMVFRDKFQYFSDSRGQWVRGHPLDSDTFANKKNLHLCMHPIWWTFEPKTPSECLIDLVQKIDIRTKEYLSVNCQVWNQSR